MALTEQEEFELLSLEREKSIGNSQQAQQAQPEMEKQNIFGQIGNVPGAALRSLLQGGNYTQGAIQPSSVPKFQDLAPDRFRTDVANATSKIPNETLRNLINYASAPAAAGLGVAGAVTDLATDPLSLLTSLVGVNPKIKDIATANIELKNEKLAGNVVNSLIRPIHKEYMFGKNPGLAVAKEGITAGNLEELGQQVGNKIESLKQAVSTIRSTPENIYKSVDLSNIKQPLIDSLKTLKNTPRTNSTEISGIEDATADISDLLQKVDKIGLNKLPINDAYQIKDAVSKMQKWDRPGTDALNKSLKQVYHQIDTSIDTAVPELKDLNSRMSNLISAQQAILRRSEALMKQEPGMTLSKILDLPFIAMKTPRAKTMLGKLLAKQYAIPK